MAQRYARAVAEVRESLCDAYLEPEANWFCTLVDRRDRAIFCTANRHYLSVDEPDRPIEPALDEILLRWEADDSDLIVVPRMPNSEREAHMLAFAQTLVDPTMRATFEARARAMRARWDDYWRPGSFHHLADDLGPSTQAWHARILSAAETAITRFAADHDISLDGLAQVVFD